MCKGGARGEGKEVVLINAIIEAMERGDDD